MVFGIVSQYYNSYVVFSAGWSGGSVQQQIQRVQQAQGRHQIHISGAGKHHLALAQWDVQYNTDNHDNEFGRILDEFIDIVPDEIVDTSK